MLLSCNVLQIEDRKNMLQFYRQPALSEGKQSVLLKRLNTGVSEIKINNLATELCFYIQLQKNLKGMSWYDRKILQLCSASNCRWDQITTELSK